MPSACSHSFNGIDQLGHSATFGEIARGARIEQLRRIRCLLMYCKDDDTRTWDCFFQACSYFKA